MPCKESPAQRLSHDGCLSLEFERRRNRTVLTDCFQSPPLKASRELYLNAADPSEATVYLMQSSGGLLEGDRNEFQVAVGAQAHVCLTPQAATAIYPSHQGAWSKQGIHVSVGPGGRLAWKTEATIPFCKARFCGQTVVTLAPDATLLWGEVIAPGRIRSGEKFQYRDFKMSFQVWREKRCLIYDPLVFSPERTRLNQRGLLEDYSYIGSLWLVAPDLKWLDAAQINRDLQQSECIRGGASLFKEGLVSVRWLATDLVLLRQEIDRLWNKFSQGILTDTANNIWME